MADQEQQLATELTRAYGVEHPVALAGMAFVGTAPDLAIAICRGGGIGSIAAGPLSAGAIRSLIRRVRDATGSPLNVNFLTFLCRDDALDVCIDEQVPIVSFHWGHPCRNMIDRLHNAGVKVWEQVGSVDAARIAASDGIDLVIAQGTEAGGHNYGTLPTFVLVPAIVDAIAPVPVLAAGGIATGRQLAAALVLGAAGAWIGTRFVASVEAYAHRAYKQQLLTADGVGTRLTSVYGPDHPTFNPMRVLDVGLAHEFAGRECEAPRDLSTQPRIATMRLLGQEVSLHRFSNYLPTPDTEGDVLQLPLLAGQGVGFVRDIQPAAEILQSLVAEAASALSSGNFFGVQASPKLL